MKHATLVLALAASAALAGCASPERSRSLNDPAVAPRTMAEQVCSNCHGVDGNPVSPNFPRLAGQVPAYTVAQLKAFRSHERADPAGFEYMWGLSRHLTDAQIDGLAAYFAAQHPARDAGSVDPALAAQGRTLFEKGLPAKNLPACAVCHGPAAQGHDGFPRLAGQHADYVVKQLTVFQRTDERHEGAIMKTIAHQLSRTDIEAVAAYLQSMPPG